MNFEDNISKFYNQLQLSSELSYRAFREQAWQSFLEVGLPNKTEDWKYTNLKPLHQLDFNGLAQEIDLPKFISENVIAPNYLVIVDGVFREELSIFPNTTFLEIKRLSQHSEQEAVAVNTLGSLQKFAPADFQTLNSALFEDALILTFKPSFILESAIQIINITLSNFSAPRIFYKVQESVSVEILESFYSFGQNLRLVAPVSEYFVGQNAELKVYKIVQEGAETYHVSSQISQLDRDSRFYCYTFNLKNGVTRNNLFSRMINSGAYASLVGLNVVGGEEHVDNFTVLDHVAPLCESYELYKSVLGQKSKTAFSGTIIVEQDAQKTNAIQSNQTLLLSDQAQSFAKPQLKIWADDVKCTHGATAGNLDEEALFYLKARGIPASEAKRLLVEAFAGEVISLVKNESIKDYLQIEIAKKLLDLIAPLAS